MCAVDSAGRLTFANPAAEAMLGRPGSGVAGELSAAPSFLAAPALRAIELEGIIRNDDTTFERADGSVFPVAFTASPIIDGDEVVGAVIAFRDIAERKVFEEQLAQHAFHDALTSLAEPPALPRPPRPCDPALEPQQRDARRAVRRCRPVQADQRQPRPPRRRPAADRDGRAPAARCAPATCSPASAATSSPCCWRTSTTRTTPSPSPAGCWRSSAIPSPWASTRPWRR